MLITKTHIRGAKGFKKNMGVDEVVVDFTGRTGLIALSGPNGRGKTTLLEMMSQYRTLASRTGAFRHHFNLRDSFIRNEFEFDGSKFETLRKIDSDSDRGESFVRKNNADEYETNGKHKEYDEYIEGLFGSETLFYNSVFCAQNSGNMSSLTTGKIKELFVEFLQIERLAEYEKSAKSAVAFFLGEKKVLVSEIENLSKLVDTIPGFKAELLTLEHDKENHDLCMGIILGNIKTSNSDLEALKKSDAQNQANQERKKDIQKQVDTAYDARRGIIMKSESAKKTFEEKQLTICSSITDLGTIISDSDRINTAILKIASLTEKKKHFSSSLELAMTEQQTVESDLRFVSELIEGVRVPIEGYKTDHIIERFTKSDATYQMQLRTVREELKSFNSSLVACGNNAGLITTNAQIKFCKEKIALAIDPNCTSEDCPALISIEQARIELPTLVEKKDKIEKDLETEMTRLTGEIKTGSDKEAEIVLSIDANLKEWEVRRKAISVEVGKLESLLAEHTRIKTGLSELLLFTIEAVSFYRDSATQRRTWIDQLSPTAAKKPELDTAELRKSDLEKQLLELVSGYKTDGKEIATSFETQSKLITELERKLSDVQTTIVTGVAEKIAEIKKKLSEFDTDKVKAESDIESTGKQIAIINASIERISLDKSKMNSKKIMVIKINNEIQEWTYLQLACSKTGLQALEIDGATPLICKEANSLLAATDFGLEFQIKIITQDPESNKEVFWIKVIRGDGSEDDFAMLSGGEQVWVAKALGLGMTLVSKAKSGKTLLSMFADEQDGPLDPEKALSFISLYRAVMEIGGFITCMFISHNPEAVAMADHVLDFSGEGPKWLN